MRTTGPDMESVYVMLMLFEKDMIFTVLILFTGGLTSMTVALQWNEWLPGRAEGSIQQ